MTGKRPSLGCIEPYDDQNRFNRPYFEQAVQNALRGRDMYDILAYYSRSPSSGLWILDYDEKFLGLIALDASLDSVQCTTPQKSSDYGRAQKGTAQTAIIRHFYIDEVYRSSGIQGDLLRHAVQTAFDSDDHVLRIRAFDSPLNTYIRSCLQEAGFAIERPVDTVGLFKWKINMRILERDVWNSRDSASQ